MPLGLLREPALRRDEPPVRTAAQPGIFAIAPIDEVVATFRAGSSVVRDLIGRKPFRMRELPCRIEQSEAQVLVWKLEFARITQALEDGVGLDGQLIERDMVSDMVERSCELIAPLGLGLSRSAVDEVEAEAGKERGGELNRMKRLGDRVLAPERLEVGVAQRLHADRQAVDAGGAISAKPPRFDAGRVGFERDLGVRLEAPSRTRSRR